jgi:CBS domain containing-hemolysin-like protein
MGWLLLIFLSYFLCLLVERSLVSISTQELDALRTDERRAARMALYLSTEIRPVLAALLLARILLLSLAGILVAVYVQDEPSVQSLLHWLATTIQVSPTFVWVVAGAILALALALLSWGIQRIDFLKNNKELGVFFLRHLWWFAYFWKILFKVFAHKESTPELEPSGAEVEAHGPIATQAAASEKRELELLKSIVQFSDVTVKQVMQPRSKVVSVDFRTNFHDLLEVVRKSEFSRLPVHHEDLDNVTGILYVKDLVPYLDHDADYEWQPLIRTNILMVPEAKRGSELLQEFKQHRMHMAVVVDEYGGIAGIVTMEDILEEVTGEIRDEFDKESEIRYRKMDEFNYLFEGQTLLNDVCRITGLEPGIFDSVRGAADTFAGLVLELRGDIPLVGTEIAWNGFLFTVTVADKRRIEQLKLTLPKAQEA